MSDATADRLQQIQEELAGILETRLAELNQTLSVTEQTTRRIIAAEVELQRQGEQRERLQGELASLQGEVTVARERAVDAREGHSGLLEERDKLRTELDDLERTVRDADGEAERTRERVRALEAEAETLRSENTSLKLKLRTLEENISRMRRLKEELMSSISGLTAQMTGIAGGGND